MPTIHVIPSDRIFDELGNNTYSIPDLFSELIDNSLAASIDDKLKITFKLYFDQKKHIREFSCIDTASGISLDDLGTVISPAASISKNPLNEHGMGLKQTVAAIGNLKYLATRPVGSDKTYLVERFGWGDIDVKETDLLPSNGTEIRILVKDDSRIRSVTSTYFRNTCKELIGARYRYFLNPEMRKVTIVFEIYDYQDNLETTIDIERVRPIYFNTLLQDGSPVISKFPIKGKNWSAKLTFGYAPTEYAHWEILGIDPPTKNYDPYKLTMSHQGLDIIINHRVLKFHQLSEIGIVKAPHNQFNDIRGELELIEGFKTSVTKNNIINDTNFEECVEHIKKILSGEEDGPGKTRKSYLRRRANPDELPEALLRDRLQKNLEKMVHYNSTDIVTEYKVEKLEGSIDLFATMDDGTHEIWELKNEPACAKDVYQLFMYMDVESVKIGYLMATSFSNGANFAAEHISNKYKLKIQLVTPEEYNIVQPMTLEESKIYG